MRNVFALILLVAGMSFSALHHNSRTTAVHTPFRWVFADSAARVAEAVTTSDTDKVAYQRSDSSMWVLRDNSPKTWIELNNNFGDLFADSINALRGVNIDSGLTVGKTTATDSLSSTKGIDAPRGSFDSLNFGTSGFIRCDSGSFPCTLHISSGAWGIAKDTAGVAYWQRTGKVVTIAISLWSVDFNGSIAYIGNFPDSLTPNPSNAGSIQVVPFPVIGGSWVLTFNSTAAPNAKITSDETERRILRPCFTYLLTDYAW